MTELIPYCYVVELIKVIDGNTLDIRVDLGFDVLMGLKIKILQHKNPTIVRYELQDPRRGQGCNHDSIRVSESTSLTKVQKESGLNSLN